jgi:hypothetical protein
VRKTREAPVAAMTSSRPARSAALLHA